MIRITSTNNNTRTWMIEDFLNRVMYVRTYAYTNVVVALVILHDKYYTNVHTASGCIIIF